MSDDHILARLKAAGTELPQVQAPKGNYVPFLITGNQLFISGQLPPLGAPDAPSPFQGIVGGNIGIDDAKIGARHCAISLMAQARAALGSLDRVARVVKLGGFVRASAGFSQHPQVINGASDLFVEIFGDLGRHTRSAVGVTSLPFDVCVEIDAVFEIRF